MNEDIPEPDLITLRTFTNYREADMARMTLAGSGIDAFVSSDDCGRIEPFMQLVQGVKLVIRSEDAVRAKEILESVATPQDDEPT